MIPCGDMRQSFTDTLVTIIRPHRMEMRSIVIRFIAWSVCRSVAAVRPAKTAEAIEMPFAWIVDSGVIREACVRWGVHWRPLYSSKCVNEDHTERKECTTRPSSRSV